MIINAERLKKAEDKEKGSLDVESAYYMDQSGTLDNACGIIACVHAILNNLGDDKIKLVEGKTLANFQAATAGQTPAERATFMEGFTAFQ